MSLNFSIKLNRSAILGLMSALAFSQSIFIVNAAENISTQASAPEETVSVTTPSSEPQKPTPKSTKWQPGEELSVSTNTEDLVPTDDIALAQKQVQAYPDSPEASFILAVALTRTSRVEEALKEVRRARKLAEVKGGTAYFDKMIESYEEMLKNYPNENRVRYGLAWAYYMKAYLLANYSRKVAAWKAVNGDPAAAAAGQKPATDKTTPAAKPQVAAQPAGLPNISGLNLNKLDLTTIATTLGALAQNTTAATPIKIPSVMDKVDPADAPQIKKFYQLALQRLDELLAQKPDDVWALVYRAHLKAEYTGDMTDAMKTWLMCREKFPNNPAPYFFLGEGYLKQGNMKESITNVSRAVALRSMGF